MIVLATLKSVMVSLLSTNVGRGLVVGLVVLSLWQVDRVRQRAKGAADAVQNIERQQTDALRKADKAGRASRDPSARGVRDPYTRP